MDGPDARAHCQYRMRVPPGWSETVVWQLQEAGFGSALAELRLPAGVLEEEDARPCEEEVVVVVEPPLCSLLEEAWPAWVRAWGWSPCQWSLRCEPVSDEDPEEMWRRRWKPFRCAGFAVRASFHQAAQMPRRAGDVPLVVTTGGAFGTGGHASTRMGLRAVRAACRGSAPRRVLDAGTGSGILAVAAALLGAGRVAGMDPDERSPVQARATGEINGVGARCRFWRGPLASARGSWDLVLANLVADLLLEHADLLVSLLAPGGLLFAGGIVERREEAMDAAWAARGLRTERSWARGRWTARLASVR